MHCNSSHNLPLPYQAEAVKPTDKMNVKTAKILWSAKLERVLEEVPHTGELRKFMQIVRGLYDVFHENTTGKEKDAASYSNLPEDEYNDAMERKIQKLDEIMTYLKEWRETEKKRDNDDQHFLTKETFESIEINHGSFKRMVTYCRDNNLRLNTHSLSTNPVENFFSLMVSTATHCTHSFSNSHAACLPPCAAPSGAKTYILRLGNELYQNSSLAACQAT
jgi:hypothetical protein